MQYLNTKTHYDNCRFCWMCRQVCTVATMTNDETQSPRSRGLAMFACEKDMIEFDASFAKAMYQCAMCDYCHTWCEGDYDPQKFVVAARRDAVDKGIEPESVKRIEKALAESGNVFSTTASEAFRALWSTLPRTGDVLVLAGGVIPFKAVEIAEAAVSVFRKLGIDVAGIEETTGAYELYVLGYYDRAFEKARQLVQEINDSQAKTVVTLDTQERYFLTDLKELFGLELAATVVDFSEFIEAHAVAPAVHASCAVNYHDDSYLARKCAVTEAPRRILASIPETTQIEDLWCKKQAHATPSALYGAMCPDIAGKMVSRKIDSFLETGADTLVVSAAIDYTNMREAGINVVSLAEYLDRSV